MRSFELDNLMKLITSVLQQQPPPTNTSEWITLIDTYAKVFGGVIAVIVALIGLPVAAMQIRKTRVEI